jgi:hypothetical protein
MRRSWLGLVGAWIIVLASASPALGLATVGTARQVSTTGAPGDFSSGASDPTVAFDGASRAVLAVWEIFGPVGSPSDVVAARLLSAGGRPLGPEFLVPGLATTAPSGIAVSAVGRGFLIAAAVNTADRGTRIVDVAVSSTGSVGPARALSPAAPFPVASVGAPSVASEVHKGRAIVSWPVDSLATRGYARYAGGVSARVVDGAGRPLGPTRQIYGQPAGSSGVDEDVSIAYQPTTGRWLAAWSEQVFYFTAPVHASKSLFARSLTAAARPAGPARRLTSPAEFTNAVLGAPTLATPPASGDWLVLFPFDNGQPRSVRVIRLAPDGIVAGREPTQVSVRPGSLTAGSASPVAIFAPALDRYVLVYSQACNQTKGESCPEYDPVVGQLVATDGRRSGGAVTLAPRAIGGDALVRTGSHSLLLVWPGAAASGTPYADATAEATIYPQKSEIYAQAVGL